MATTEAKPELALHLVQVLDRVWGVQAEIRGLADEAQWVMQDACAALGLELRSAAPEVRSRADQLARAALSDKAKDLGARLRAIAASLEGVDA